MRFLIPFSIILVTDILFSESECVQSTPKDGPYNLTPNPVISDVSVGTNANINLNALWLNNPMAQIFQADTSDDTRRVISRAPFSITKLVKSLTYRSDPFFNKGYFEPFERRPKPVTLIAFRKNGLLPRKIAKIDEETSMEIAELQSPFNYISNLWQDGPSDS